MGALFKSISSQKSIAWHRIGFQINPMYEKNTIELCKLLSEAGLENQVLHLNKHSQLDCFMENATFLSIYCRCNFQKLYFQNGIKYLLKLIQKTAPVPCTTEESKIEKWKNYNDIGYVYCAMGNIEKALHYTDKATELAKKFNLKMAHQLMSYSNLLCYSDFCCGDNAAGFQKRLEINNYLPNRNMFSFANRKAGPKIKIGYLSSDFEFHAVGNFLVPILKNHDRSRFEIVLFANQKKMVDLFTSLNIIHFCIVYLNDDDAAKLIHKENVDILVDLNGHTVGNRLGIFSRNPAPIQISYLGYPNSTGLKGIQYRIVDPVSDNVNSNQIYSEELLRMPRCFLLYKSITQTQPTRPKTVGKTIILGGINKENKNTKYTLDVWRRILKECPNAKLMIKIETFDNNEERLQYYMKALDTTTDRLIIINKQTNEEYDVLFSKFDLLLDTFPYSGTTTTCNSLYNSIPVVTKYHADYHSHNVSSSILMNAGLPELIAYTDDEYVAIVKDLVNNPEKITNYHKTIHAKFVNSMEPQRFMKYYEALLEGVYDRFFHPELSAKPQILEEDPPVKKDMTESFTRITIEMEEEEPTPSPVLFISVFDYGSSDLGINHLRSIQTANMDNYMAFVTDQRCYDKVRDCGFHVTLIDNTVELAAKGFFQKKKDFGGKDFTEMSFLRYKIISEQLMTHKAVWYMDVDTVVLEDLNKYYEKYKNSQFDMIFQNDIHQITRCTGCVLYFSSPKIIDITAHIYKGMNDTIPDQHYMHYFLENNPNLVEFTLFDYMSFPNGLLYFDNEDLIGLSEEFTQIKEQYRNNKSKRTSFVHANWMVGVDAKIRAFKKMGLWLGEPTVPL